MAAPLSLGAIRFIWVLGINFLSKGDLKMTDSNNLIDRIRGLSDKQACHIVKSLTQDVFSSLPSPPSFDELGGQIGDLASEAGVQLDLKSTKEWYATEMTTDDSGAIVRILLENLAVQPGLEGFIDKAIERYVDESLDLGIISVGVAIAMVYVAIAGDIDLDLGWFKFKKKGLSASQQKEVVIKTLPQVAKAFASGG